MREVSIANRHPRLRFERRAVERVIRTLDQHAAEVIAGGTNRKQRAVPPGELSLVFLTDAALAKLHADFLDDPTITDVITFEGDPMAEAAGEICVSADAAARHVASSASPAPKAAAPLQAKRGRSASDSAQSDPFSTELTLYLVHGWLHLAGHDDLEPRKKQAMRRAEARAMKLLASEKCLPRFQLTKKRA